MKLLRFLQNLGALMKPKALDCCRNYSFEGAYRGVTRRQKLRCSQQSRAFGFIVGSRCALLSLFVVSAPTVNAELVRVADGKLQVGFDTATGSVRELIHDGYNQIAESPAPLGLWQISVASGESSQELTAERAGTPKIERLSGDRAGLRLVWDKVESLRVEVVIRLGQQNAALSR